MSQTVYALSAITSIVLCAIVWRHREKAGAVPLFGYVVSGSIIVGSTLINSFVQQFALSSFLYRFVYVGVGLSVVSLLVFALEYTNREHLVRRKILALLAIHPVLVVIGAFLNPANVFFASIAPDSTSLIGIAYEPGIGWWIHTTYSYALVLVSTLLFVDLLYRSRAIYRGQSVALVGGAVIPSGAIAASIVGIVSFDLAPIGISIASVLFTAAIVRYRLIDVVPIARDRVLNTVSDGVFVVDREDRLVDVNAMGRRLFDDVDDGVVGRGIESLFADTPEVLDAHAELTARRSESEREFAVGDRFYHVRATPIDDGRDRPVGWLFLVRDVTERNGRERRLERQNERLEGFADLVSHDLRNPLNVADGYLDLARETGDDDAYLDEIAKSHERMGAIIEDVLALAREGEAVTSPNPVDFETLADRARENVDTRDAALEIRSNATIVADADRTTRLLENLFRNAVEHGPGSETERTGAVEYDETERIGESGGLRIVAGTFGGDGRDAEGFWIEDDGAGIPEHDRDRLFEQGFTTTSDGTGLGLSIVRRIAEAHGWTVAAVEGESGGARFEISGVESVDGGTYGEQAPERS